MTDTARRKAIVVAINCLSIVYLYWFITTVTLAYIGADYPEVADTTLRNLTTLPNFFGLVTSFFIGPLALKVSQRFLTCTTVIGVVCYCAIFYINGSLHGPFVLYSVASALAGYAQGSHAVLLNSILSKHYPAEMRGERIANYNVFLNLGALIVLQVSGIIAAKGDGEHWYNAYLLGVLPIIGMIIFMVLTGKADADVPSIKSEAVENSSSEKVSLKDIPRKTIGLVVLMALCHAMFYISQFAFNSNVSSYVVTEYELGTAAQAGTVTSMVRLAMIVFTALFAVFNKLLKNWMIPLGYFASAIGLAIMMVGKSLPAAFICAICIGLATSLAHSSVYARASTQVPVALVPVVVSLVQGITNIGTSVSVYVMAALSNLSGGGMSGRIMAGVIFATIAGIVAIILYVVKKIGSEAVLPKNED